MQWKLYNVAHFKVHKTSWVSYQKLCVLQLQLLLLMLHLKNIIVLKSHCFLLQQTNYCENYWLKATFSSMAHLSCHHNFIQFCYYYLHVEPISCALVALMMHFAITLHLKQRYKLKFHLSINNLIENDTGVVELVIIFLTLRKLLIKILSFHS